MFIPKFDIMERLKKCGYNSTRILKDGVFGQSVAQNIRCNKAVASAESLDNLCRIFNLQPSDIYRYISEEEYEMKKAADLLKPYEIAKKSVRGGK